MNLFDLHEKFKTELDAVMHFEKVRWGMKVKCGFCKSERVSKQQADMRFFCKECSKSFSVTTNTRIHDTRLPLQKWLMAFAIGTDAKKGLSSKQLERNLGIHYETAFNMYHNIREMMYDENTKIADLDGIVEMDEIYVGPKRSRLPNTGKRKPSEGTLDMSELDEGIDELEEQGIEFKRGKGNPAKVVVDVKRGRGTKKIPVVGIVEHDRNVVAEVMRTLTYENLKDMVQKYVNEYESVLVTDEYRGYNKMEKIIEHIKIDHQKLYSYRGVNTNNIESFWAIIKRQLIGQHRHVTVKHLPKYEAEAVFKYNNRGEDDTMFETLVKNSMKQKIQK